jgi:hypothetical protein
MRALDIRAADLRGREHGREMLPQEPRLRPPCADLLEMHRLSGHHRKGERRSQNLPAPFAGRAVDRDHQR